MSDDSELGDTWKTFVPNLAGFSVSFDRFWADETQLDDLGTTQAVALYTNTVNAYRYDGLGRLSNFGVSVDRSDLVTETNSFEGVGEAYYTNLVIKDS